MLIQSCRSSNICEATGITNGQLYYNRKRIGYYSNRELVKALRVIQNTEEKVKTGMLDEDISLDYALINIL